VREIPEIPNFQELRAKTNTPVQVPERAAAQQLLVSTLPLMKAPPVNLGVICAWLDIEVYAMPCRAFGAILFRRNGRYVLLANSKLAQGRFRFSIAHELGHFLLNHKPSPIGGKRNPFLERQADAFAAELLLPEGLLRADCAAHTADQLAKRYKVSKQALSIQLNTLGLP
jgi:Zn-dependent peptidase ImmA (M78 family)